MVGVYLGSVNPARFLSRSTLGAVFVYSGIDVLRDPEPRAQVASPLIDRVSGVLPSLTADRVRLVQANAALQATAGSLLVLGKAPRLAALALATSLVPTTAAGHRFWEEEDPYRAGQQRVHFLKNAAIFGGLLSTALYPGSGRAARRRRRRRRAARAARLAGTAMAAKAVVPGV